MIQLLLVFMCFNVFTAVESGDTISLFLEGLQNLLASLSSFNSDVESLSSLVGRSSFEISKHQAWKYFDDGQFECGESNADRIIGGEDAALGQYPWIALLGYEQYGEILFLCGGTLINSWYVLTAAHCTATEDWVLKMVRLGEYDVSKTIDCFQGVCAPPVQDILIEKITIHENYNNPPFMNDVALLKLSHRADFNGWVAPICLPRKPINTTYGMVEVCGWGVKSMKTMEQATVLQTLKIPLQNMRLCQRLYSGIEIGEQNICAGGKVGKDSCGGDSGGPLMKVDADTGTPKYYLIGIVSFGPTKCGSKAPGIYVKVDFFLNWILDNIKS